MKFFSHNNNASNEQSSSVLEYVSSPAPSALPDKETREGAFCPSRVLDALKSPVKVGLSTRGLLQCSLINERQSQPCFVFRFLITGSMGGKVTDLERSRSTIELA